MDDFTITRGLYRNKSQANEGDPLSQTLNTPTIENVEVPYNKDLYGTADFPQPYFAGYGYIVASGGASTTKFFLPSRWSATKTGTGVYKITHNIGDNTRYLVLSNANSSAAYITTIANINNNDVEIRTFNDAGAATDIDFSFAILQNL